MTGGAPGEGPVRLHRDALTRALYSSFVTWGWFLYGFSPAVPLIADELDISRAQAGLHGTAMAVGTIVAGAASARVAARVGRRLAAQAGLVVLVVGVAALLAGRSLTQTLLACAVTAVGGNLLLSAAQPALVLHHRSAGAAAVTEGNAMGSTVGLLAPLAVGGAVALGWGWRPAVAATAAFALLTGVLLQRLGDEPVVARPRRATLTVPLETPPLLDVPPLDSGVVTAGAGAGAGAGVAGRAGAGGRTGAHRFGRTFWFFWVAMVCGVAIEFATTFWAADLVLSRTGAPASVATAAVSALVLGMSAARFVIGPLSMRKAPEKLLLAAYAVALAGFAVLWAATSPALAVTGLVLAGVGYGAHYPLAVALVLRAAGARADHAQSVSTMGAGIAVAVSPFLLGALADAFGSHRAFLLVPVLMLVGAAAVALGLRSVHAARVGVPA